MWGIQSRAVNTVFAHIRRLADCEKQSGGKKVQVSVLRTRKKDKLYNNLTNSCNFIGRGPCSIRGQTHGIRD
jgi:hypothetical protein